MKSLLVFIIRLYQLLLSPLLPFNSCRFFPSCSEYSIEAILKYGAWKGTLLGAKRIARCHPFHKKSGFDPVP